MLKTTPGPRAVALPLIVAAALTAAGCGTSAASGEATPTATQNNEAALLGEIGKENPSAEILCGGRDDIVLGFDVFSDQDAFAAQLTKRMESLASELGCVTINKLTDNLKADTALANAKVFAQQKVDGAILFNVVAAAAPGQAQVLERAGIPAVTVGIPAPNLPFLTVDEAAAGKSAGEELGDAYNSSGRTGEVYLVSVRNDVVGQAGIERMDAFAAAVQAKVPGVTDDHVLAVQAGDPATALARTRDVLGNVPDGSTILLGGINDDIGYGAVRAAQQAGRGDDTMIVAMGAVNPTGLEYICQNEEYVGGVSYRADVFGTYALEAALASVHGAKPDDKIVIPTPYVARDEIAAEFPDFDCGS